MGGHHYDYTRLVAQAAGAAGLRPVIATHRSLDAAARQALQQIGDVRPAFTQTVYTPLSHLAGLAELKPPRWRHQPHDRGGMLAGWRRWRAGWNRSRLIRARSRRICQFASDCERLFADDLFDEADQVFFTTMSELDLMGLTCFLANHPRSLLPTWHVQFHFSIFSGRASEFEDQWSREVRVHDCFQSALARVPYHSLKFHTTSSELTQQYQRFQMMQFDELPYPVEPRLFANPSDVQPGNRALRVTIAGGVRREKAQKCYLGHLLDTLWDSHLRPGKVEIHLQTGQPRAFGRRAVFPPTRARCVSEQQYRRHVHFHPHPLPETEYLQLIENADIGLFFYDSRRYYSRRAGILGEFLAGGKPVIVPAGCWLSRQISEAVFQHVENVIRNARAVQTICLNETTCDPRNAPQAGGVLCFDQLKNPWRCRHAISDLNPQGLAVQFGWQWPGDRSEYVNVSLRCLDASQNLLQESRQIISIRSDGNPSLGLFRCPPQTRFTEFVFRNAYCDRSLSLSGLKFHVLNYGGLRGFPLSAVGMIVADPTELPAAVDEIVRHYPHYRGSAVAFAETWAACHDPDLTVDALLDRQDRFRTAA